MGNTTCAPVAELIINKCDGERKPLPEFHSVCHVAVLPYTYTYVYIPTEIQCETNGCAQKKQKRAAGTEGQMNVFFSPFLFSPYKLEIIFNDAFGIDTKERWR